MDGESLIVIFFFFFWGGGGGQSDISIIKMHSLIYYMPENHPKWHVDCINICICKLYTVDMLIYRL